ncbi:unnamed protein product [Alopecurus aequalis]
MASPRTAFLRPAAALLLLVATALLVSSCHASPHASAGGEKAATMGRVVDPKCSEMTRCSPSMCTDYCNLIGLMNQKGFCTFHGLLFYCCCPVPFRRDAAPVISS